VHDPEPGIDPETALAAAGHEVLVAYSARDAAERLSEGGFDVVVIDTAQPRGIVELADAIAKLPEALPVVLVSGSPQAPLISARIGVAQFVPKPAEVQDLLAAVDLVLRTPRPVQAFDDEEPTGPARQFG
jgi:DNA-binding NtrC family response regulator